MAGMDANTSRSAIRSTLNSLEINKQNQDGNVRATTTGPHANWQGAASGVHAPNPKRMASMSGKVKRG